MDSDFRVLTNMVSYPQKSVVSSLVSVEHVCVLMQVSFVLWMFKRVCKRAAEANDNEYYPNVAVPNPPEPNISNERQIF